MANPFVFPQVVVSGSAAVPPLGPLPTVTPASATSLAYSHQSSGQGDQVVVLNAAGSAVISVGSSSGSGTLTGLTNGTTYKVAVASAGQLGPMAAVLLWRPTDVASCLLDYEASAASLFTDVAGTVPVSADGDLVARWSDRGPLGIHLTQATSGLRPVARLTRGRWRLEFDGTKYLTGAGIGGNSGNMTVGWRGVPGVAATSFLIDLSNSYLVFSTANDTSHYGWYDGAWEDSAIGSGTTDQSAVWLPTAGKVRINGSQVATGMTWNTGRAMNSTTLGAGHDASNGFVGSIRRACAFAIDTSGATLTNLETYLAG